MRFTRPGARYTDGVRPNVRSNSRFKLSGSIMRPRAPLRSSGRAPVARLTTESADEAASLAHVDRQAAAPGQRRLVDAKRRRVAEKIRLKPDATDAAVATDMAIAAARTAQSFTGAVRSIRER